MLTLRRLSLAFGIAAVAATLLGTGTGAVASSPQLKADTPVPHVRTFRMLQMNMCMSGRPSAGPCFNKIDDAAAKRHTIIREIRRNGPTAVTINEGCSADLDKVAAVLEWQVRYQPTANGRPCSDGRGNSVNAILAKHFSSKYQISGYFHGSISRSYICTGVHHIIVCTAHLRAGLTKESVDVRNQQCNQLRHILRTRYYPTVFGGDVNLHAYGVRSGHELQNCAPSDFNGMSDAGAAPQKWSLRGLQQIYYRNVSFELPGCGVTMRVPHTDHWGLLVRLERRAPAAESLGVSGGESGCLGQIRW